MLDLSALREYCDDKMLAEALAIYARSLDADLQALRAAVGAQDLKAAEMSAHRIKGAARMVGALRVAQSSEPIEMAALAGDWGPVHSGMPALEADSRHVLDAIAARGAA